MKKVYKVIKEDSTFYDTELMYETTRKRDAEKEKRRLERIENLKNKYPTLDKTTENVCFKSDAVKGVVNFASPLILFYSDIADASTNINFLSQLMVKNIVENDIFFLGNKYNSL